MTENTAKVYIVVNKGMIESVYSEDGNLTVAVFDMDSLKEEPDTIRKEIENWRNDLRKLTTSGGKLNEIEYWDAKEII